MDELITLHEGPSAYSNLIKIDKNIIGCLFEAGLSSPYEGIVFQKFNLTHKKIPSKDGIYFFTSKRFKHLL